LLKAGIKPAFAAQQLGHSLQMFFRIYAKWIDVDETKKQEKMMDAI
jgi:integrase